MEARRAVVVSAVVARGESFVGVLGGGQVAARRSDSMERRRKGGRGWWRWLRRGGRTLGIKDGDNKRIDDTKR